MNWEDAKAKFSLANIYHDFQIKLLEFPRHFRDMMLNQQSAQLNSTEWVGLYRNTDDTLHEWVVNAAYLKEISSDLVQFSAEFMSTFPKCTIHLQYFTLMEEKPNTKNETPPMAFLVYRVDSFTKGNRQMQFILFFEKLDQLFLTILIVVTKGHSILGILGQVGKKMGY